MTKKTNNWGGHRKGAGRKPGSPNKATKDQKRTLSEMTRDHTDIALAALAEVATSGSTDSARVAAAVAILDRGYGRPISVQETDRRPPSIYDEIQSICDELGVSAEIQQAPIYGLDSKK